MPKLRYIAVLLFALGAIPLFSESTGVDWLKPTGGAYPQLQAGQTLWINVSLKRAPRPSISWQKPK